MALGNDASVHFIRDGRFVCIATPAAKCRNYPACECEEWSAELHGDPPADGHCNVPQDECWLHPWINSTDLRDSYGTGDVLLDDDEFPDGPVSVEWQFDYVMWEYADDTDPARQMEEA